MASVSMSTIINASAEKVWQTVSDFNGLGKFVAAVTKSSMEGSGVGALRTLTLPDGAEIVEKLESFEEQTKELKYLIVVSGPFPVEGYIATMKVKELGENRCEFQWSSTFEPKGASEEEAKKAIEDVYSMGFEGLKKLYGG